MTPEQILILVIVAVVVLLTGIFAGLRLARLAPGRLEQKVEAEAFALGVHLLLEGGDTSGEDKIIAAATRRKELRALFLQQAAAQIQAHTATSTATVTLPAP